jgi:hypothetical protein
MEQERKKLLKKKMFIHNSSPTVTAMLKKSIFLCLSLNELKRKQSREDAH